LRVHGQTFGPIGRKYRFVEELGSMGWEFIYACFVGIIADKYFSAQKF
jgi:hypothetical protein